MADFTVQNFVTLLTLSISLCGISYVYSTKYACFMKPPTYYKKQQYFQLCDDFENNVWKGCLKIKCHMGDLKKQPNEILNDNTTVPDELSQKFQNIACSATSCDFKSEKKDVYKKTSHHHKDNKHILVKLKSWPELDLKVSNFWFDDEDMKTSNSSIVKNNYKHGGRVKELIVLCNLNTLLTTKYATTHIINLRQKRSTSSVSSSRKFRKYQVSTVMTTTTKLESTPLILFKPRSTDFVTNLPKKYASNIPMTKAKSDPMTPKITVASITKRKIDKITTTTTKTKSTPTIPPVSSPTTRNHDSSSIKALPTPSASTYITTKIEPISERFECPNGKMWRTIDLTEIGESCLVVTVRSKLECMAISQQQKCPHAFYQKSTSTCQSFFHLISKSATSKQLDCVNNHCYTCVGRP